MKIILADTHGPILGKEQPAPNLSLLYIASYLRTRVDSVDFVYIPQKYAFDDHLQAIASWQPDIYALSFTSYGVPLAYNLINTIKSQFPWVRVICGGAHASAVPREVAERTAADVVVIGEGEVTFTELVQNLNGIPDALDSIPGIAYQRNGQYFQTPERPLIKDIDTIPKPSWDLINPEDFVGVSFSRGRPSVEMIVTRGCPYRCTFCANPVFRVSEPRYRKRTPESIAEEAEFLYQMGYREIYLHSDELNVKLKWSVDVCKALAGLGHQDLFFQCNLRVAPMSEEFAYWLKRANFWMIRFGIESANLRVLVGIKKKMSLGQTEYSCRLLSKYGIKVWGYFLLFQFWEKDGRLQSETKEEVVNSLKFAHRLWREKALHYSSWTLSMPVPGAEFYNLALRHGMVDSTYFPSDKNWDASRYLPGVSTHEYYKLFAKARRLQMMMALTSGGIDWNNWKAIVYRAIPIFKCLTPKSVRRQIA